jgi:hypothetical protein
MTNISHDLAHWQQRAEEMRAAAKEMTNAEAKEALLEVAADYDRLADIALKRAHAKFPESLPC